MHYRALYRKYRPVEFEQIVGQNHIIKTLNNTVKQDKIGHAYLFCGSRGTGKTSVARIFARLINCENLKDGQFCNDCFVCNTQNTDEIPDIIEIDAASNNGVDEIREIKNKASLAPVLCKYKVYIIDEVHMLSTGAFNALLKTLEEPPSHVVFVLATTEPHKIPTTIISRCQRFDFKKIAAEDIQSKLKEIAKEEKITIDEHCLKEISKLSDGSLRDAIGLLDQIFSFSNEKISIEKLYDLVGMMQLSKIFELIEGIFVNNIDLLISTYEEMVENGRDFEKATEKIFEILVNLMIYKNAPKYILSKDLFYIDDLLKLEKLINRERLSAIIDDLKDLLEKMKKSTNPNVLFELFLLKNINLQDIEEIEVKKEEVVPAPTKIVKQVEKNIEPSISSLTKTALINNTIALASNEMKKEVKKQFLNLKKYSLDGKNGIVANLLIDSEIIAASNDHLLITYKYESLVLESDSNSKKIDKIVSELMSTKYKVVAITSENWNTLRPKYLEMKSKNQKIELMDETIEETISCRKDENYLYEDVIIELGNDIIEMEEKI